MNIEKTHYIRFDWIAGADSRRQGVATLVGADGVEIKSVALFGQTRKWIIGIEGLLQY